MCRLFWAVAAVLSLLGQSGVPDPSSRYYLVFLRPLADRRPLPKAESDRIQAAHMENIGKMARDGVLVAAGPFEDAQRTISGIFVFRVDSLAIAQRIAAQDPTVVEHRNSVDVHAWQGPPAIGDEYFRLHKLDPKTPENMQAHPLGMFYRGPAWEQNVSNRQTRLKEHAEYIDHLRQSGKLAAAGPVDVPDELLSLVVFKPVPDEEAQRLLQQDPAVKSGLLRVEYHRWWCSDHVLPW